MQTRQPLLLSKKIDLSGLKYFPISAKAGRNINIMNHKKDKQIVLSVPPSGGQRVYISPRIMCIPLDNEISLALESTPPAGPYESKEFSTPEYLNTNPYKFG